MTEFTAQRPTRIAVVGAGRVGATYAYTLLLSGLASEIVLIDRDADRAAGEAADLNHAMPLYHPTRIWAGTFADCSGATIVVVTAGSARKPGETRLDLAQKNAAMMRQIVPSVAEHAPETILLVASNPVDVLTHIAWKLSGFPARRVIGSGNILDTARFRYRLGAHCRVDPRSVHAHIAGEHGDSEVPLWSLANVAGMPLQEFCAAQGLPHSDEEFAAIFADTRDAARPIIERKGATFYGVAAGLLRITEAILRDQNTVLSVCSPIDGLHGLQDICLSLPTVVGRGGAERILELAISDDERAGLQRCAEVLRESLDAIG
jgi:L-lactate dehydrogenase